MKLVSRTALAAVLCGCAGPVLAQDLSSEQLAAKFGARETVRSVSISPGGGKVVVVVDRQAGGENAAVIDLATARMTPIGSSRGGDEQLTGCDFATEAKVICQVYVTQGSGRKQERKTRLLVINADGSKAQQLSAADSFHASYASNYGGGLIDLNTADDPGAVLLQTWFSGEQQTGTILAAKRDGLAVEQVNLDTMRRKVVNPPRASSDEYITDGLGHVRIMALQAENGAGYATNRQVYMYRPTQDGNWTQFSTVIRNDSGLWEGFTPVAVDPTENVAYGFQNQGNFRALFKRAMDGSGTTTLVLSMPNVDVDGLIEIGRKRRVVGASFSTDRRTSLYFDSELARLRTALGNALPGAPQISIIDANEGEGKLVLFGGSDVDPGRYYIYDKASRKLGELLPTRPELAGIRMGEMKAVTYTAADGTQVPAYLTLPPGSDGKNLPAIVMPHGGPESRDDWGFDWLVQFFAVRGYAVLQPEFRGSTGFGAQWFQKGGFQSWRTAIGDVDDAGRWLVKQGIAAPGKLAIVGWSYGGYAALQSQVLDPDLFKAVVAVAPVTDLDVLRSESVGTYGAELEDRRIGHGPHVEEGSPARHADRFKAPVLLFHGEDDSNVGIGESRLMADRLKSAGKSVELVTFADLDHQLDSAGARTTMLAKSDQFLRKAMGL